jgi:hypothetical protein
MSSFGSGAVSRQITARLPEMAAPIAIVGRKLQTLLYQRVINSQKCAVK